MSVASWSGSTASASARNCALINQLATPGLGSLMAGRLVAGIGQLLLAVAGFPNRQARDFALAAECQGLADGRLGGDTRGVRQRRDSLAHGQALQIQHPVDHGPFFRAKCLGRFLHDQAEFLTISEQVAGERFAAAPAQQSARDGFDGPNQRPQ